MRFASVVKLAAISIVSSALVIPGITPATAAATYPPHVSIVYASPVLSNGYASVAVEGERLPSGMHVKATRGSKSASATMSVHSAGTVATGSVKVSSLLSTTAGRYTVTFKLQGTSLTGDLSTSQTYTVGKMITIKRFSVTGTKTSVKVSGTAAKSTPVKIAIKFGSKTYTKTVKASSSGRFSYSLRKSTRGTYTVTAQVAPNKKYFSDAVKATYKRA